MSRTTPASTRYVARVRRADRGSGCSSTLTPRPSSDVQARDPGGFTGGWAGGETALKEWAPKAAAEVAGIVKESSESAEKSDSGMSGPDEIYVGKGKYIRGDKKLFPDKELGGLTGGWAGGEVSLKTKPSLPVNSRVVVKGGPPAPWMQNALFANTAMALGGKQGVVTNVIVANGNVKVAVRLDADATQGYRVVVFKEDELQLLDIQR
jgi:hypothetical protein